MTIAHDQRPEYESLKDLLLLATDSRWVVHLDFLVLESTVPGSAIGSLESGESLRLGFSAWVKTEPSTDVSGILRTRRTVKPFSVH